MWDSSFMADVNNFEEINENFDTVKTLLNSIKKLVHNFDS